MRTLMRAFMNAQIWVYRKTSGKLGSMKGTVVLLTARGRRSGAIRSVALMANRDGERYLVAASALGEPKNPGWFSNVKADPSVTVQDHDRVVKAKATIPEGAERDELWGRFTAKDERFAKYAQRRLGPFPLSFSSRPGLR